MKNTWDRFDFKAIISYAGYDYQRHQSARLELIRVGLDDTTTFWSASTPADDIVVSATTHARALEKGGFTNSLLTHYRAVKTAWQLGKDHVLVMEDDIRFMNDTDLMSRIVDSLPDDYDLALFDWWHRQKATQQEWDALLAAPCAAPCWKRFTNLRSAACYALSRRGMREFIDLIDGAIRGLSGYKLRITDQYWPHVAARCPNCYCAWPNVAVQGYSDGGSLSNMDRIWATYNRYCIERKDYAD